MAQGRRQTCPRSYIESKVTKGDCWEWTGATFSKTGYGMACWQSKTVSAHRLSFTAFNGEIPDGLVVRHKCDNRKCCNPEHLILGTLKDNMEDCVERGRIARGSSQGLSKLTEELAIEIFLSKEPQRHLAKRLGVSQPTIGRVRRRETWAHITQGLVTPE